MSQNVSHKLYFSPVNPSITEGGAEGVKETWTTVTERENNVYAAFGKQNVAATSYAVLIDKSDTTGFPHTGTGRIDLSSTYFQVDRSATGSGVLRLGCIVSITAVGADVIWVQGIRFDNASERYINRDRMFTPSQLKLSVVNGTLNRVVTGSRSNNITQIRVGTSLDSPIGVSSVNPGVGDVVIEFGVSGGSFNGSVACFYHGETATT